MFTGVVKDTGTITKFQRTGEQLRLGIKVNNIATLTNYQIGDSCAVDGICLTATFIQNDYFELDVMPATFKKTTMIDWQVGNQVNLERAMAVAQRFEGHIVAGHVDGIGRLMRRTPNGNAVLYKFSFPPALSYGIVPQGSIAINGISLTIQSVQTNTFTVALIPHTFKQTNLSKLINGANVNLETDILSKYINKEIQLGR